MNFPDPVIKMWSGKLEVAIQFQTHFPINAIICSYLGYLFISKHCRSKKKWMLLKWSFMHNKNYKYLLHNISYCPFYMTWPFLAFLWLTLFFICMNDCFNQVFWMLQYFNEKSRIEAEMHHVVNIVNKSEVSLAQH